MPKPAGGAPQPTGNSPEHLRWSRGLVCCSPSGGDLGFQFSDTSCGRVARGIVFSVYVGDLRSRGRTRGGELGFQLSDSRDGRVTCGIGLNLHVRHLRGCGRARGGELGFQLLDSDSGRLTRGIEFGLQNRDLCGCGRARGGDLGIQLSDSADEGLFLGLDARRFLVVRRQDVAKRPMRDLRQQAVAQIGQQVAPNPRRIIRRLDDLRPPAQLLGALLGRPALTIG